VTRSIKRAVLGISLCFIILSSGLVYWQVLASQDLLSKPGNLRAVYQEQRIWRGGIFDRNGEILAKSYSAVEAEQLMGKKVFSTVRPPGDQYPTQIRLYPKGNLFAHVVGTYSFIYGKTGLEASLNKLLLGLGPNESIQSVSQSLVDKSRRGNDIVLTLDSKIQSAAVEALQGKSGAAVAIEPKTGKILAMSSAPDFNPNELDQKFKEINAIGNQVFVDKAVSAAYTPGSIMKLVTAGGLLHSGLDVRAVYQDTGRDRVEVKGESREVVDSEKEGLGSVDFFSALARSSNTYFATRAALAGDSQFLAAAQRFGFGQKLPLEELKSSSTSLRISSITAEGVPKQLKLGELMDSSYGQGQVQVTPLHMAMIAASIANGGQMMRPGLVDRVLSPKQETLYQFKPAVWLTPLLPQEASLIQQGMREAVEYGTARGLGIDGVTMAAKTGTAELGEPGKQPHGWFVAFAPAENPVIAVAVIIEHGKSGASSAGPVAKDIIQAALRERR